MTLTKTLLLISVLLALTACQSPDWRTASREPAGIAINPLEHQPAVIEVYAADAFSWRGWFAVHTWLAIKPKGSKAYTVYEVVGWRVNSGLPALRTYSTPVPDRYWYGAKPKKLLEITGDKATRLIPQLENAIANYPWANEYMVFPGPNSNTFPAWLALQVPEMGLELPFRAIGSGYASNAE